MKILKIKKEKTNRYLVSFEKETLLIYEDILFQYELLRKKELSYQEFERLKDDNSRYIFFDLCLKKLARKRMTSHQVDAFLKKEGVSFENRKKIIQKLNSYHYLDDSLFLKDYIHDACLFTLDGPYKIQKKLQDLGFSVSQIGDELSLISDDVWQDKINKIIQKRLSAFHGGSVFSWRQKLVSYLLSQGFLKEQFEPLVQSLSLKDDEALLEKEYAKQKRSLSRKYTGQDLVFQIEKRLYQKGFQKEDIDRVLSK